MFYNEKFIFIHNFHITNNTNFSFYKKRYNKNLQKTNNLSFNFEQNINGKIQNGKCIIKYPKKIFAI